jgi:hypothetical protein
MAAGPEPPRDVRPSPRRASLSARASIKRALAILEDIDGSHDDGSHGGAGCDDQGGTLGVTRRTRRRVGGDSDSLQSLQLSRGSSTRGIMIALPTDIHILPATTRRPRRTQASSRTSKRMGRPTLQMQASRGRQVNPNPAYGERVTTPSGRRGRLSSLISPSRTAKVNFVRGQAVNFGLPDVCPHCGASVWNAERSNGNWICCRNGKDILPESLFPSVDPGLRRLYTQRKFSFHSRSINNHLAFTSIGTTPSLAQGGRGMNFRMPFPSSARLQGKTYHVMSATTQSAPGYGANVYHIQVSQRTGVYAVDAFKLQRHV